MIVLWNGTDIVWYAQSAWVFRSLGHAAGILEKISVSLLGARCIGSANVRLEQSKVILSTSFDEEDLEEKR